MRAAVTKTYFTIDFSYTCITSREILAREGSATRCEGPAYMNKGSKTAGRLKHVDVFIVSSSTTCMSSQATQHTGVVKKTGSHFCNFIYLISFYGLHFFHIINFSIEEIHIMRLPPAKGDSEPTLL